MTSYVHYTPEHDTLVSYVEQIVTFVNGTKCFTIRLNETFAYWTNQMRKLVIRTIYDIL